MNFWVIKMSKKAKYAGIILSLGLTASCAVIPIPKLTKDNYFHVNPIEHAFDLVNDEQIDGVMCKTSLFDKLTLSLITQKVCKYKQLTPVEYESMDGTYYTVTKNNTLTKSLTFVYHSHDGDTVLLASYKTTKMEEFTDETRPYFLTRSLTIEDWKEYYKDPSDKNLDELVKNGLPNMMDAVIEDVHSQIVPNIQGVLEIIYFPEYFTLRKLSDDKFEETKVKDKLEKPFEEYDIN